MNRAINSILNQSKGNNCLLKCGKKLPYKSHEKRSHNSKFS